MYTQTTKGIGPFGLSSCVVAVQFSNRSPGDSINHLAVHQALQNIALRRKILERVKWE